MVWPQGRRIPLEGPPTRHAQIPHPQVAGRCDLTHNDQHKFFILHHDVDIDNRLRGESGYRRGSDMLDPNHGHIHEGKEIRLDLLELTWPVRVGVHDDEAVHLDLGAKLTRTVVRATEHLVVHHPFVDVAGEELIALARDDAVHHTGVTATLLTAPTRRGERQFVRPIGNGKESRRSREEIKQEVSRESEGVHVDREIVDHLSERVDLFDTRELRFVDHEDIDAVAPEPFDMRREIGARQDRLSTRLDADAARHHTGVASIPESPKGHVASTRAQLPAQLQRERRLARRHRSISKGKFRHEPLVVASDDQRYLPRCPISGSSSARGTVSNLGTLVAWTTPFDQSPTSATSVPKRSTTTGTKCSAPSNWLRTCRARHFADSKSSHTWRSCSSPTGPRTSRRVPGTGTPEEIRSGRTSESSPNETRTVRIDSCSRRSRSTNSPSGPSACADSTASTARPCSTSSRSIAGAFPAANCGLPNGARNSARTISDSPQQIRSGHAPTPDHFLPARNERCPGSSCAPDLSHRERRG